MNKLHPKESFFSVYPPPRLSRICNAALNIVEFVIRHHTLCFISQDLFGQLQIVQCY